jgi:signal transduction histidine kinase/CheY-like chemotaxis protein/HPt (histidine-containing phosphotransfer) domain-containing protein
MKSLFSFNSVRQKLFAGVLLTSVVALLLTGASLFVYDLHQYRKHSSRDLATEAELLGYATAAALQFDDRAVASQTLAFLRARPAIRSAAVYTPSGEFFATYTRPGIQGTELPALPGAQGVAISGDRLAVFRRIIANDEYLGTVYLEADLEMAQRIASYAVIALAVILMSLIVSLLLSAWLQAGITRPIIQISDLARRVVEKRDYAVRATRTTSDEIGTLVDGFNEMLSEIERRTAALEASNAEVGRLNKDLERRVGERTAQLEESNRQLHAANLAKSNFLSMMSHEIRTPMNGVLGMLELLSLTPLESQQRGTLEIVRGSARSLLRIIDDILDFSKIEAGKLEICPEVASVEKVIGSVVGIYSGNASSKDLVLRAQMDSGISPAVLVDPLRLQQILNNLVSNAIKFTSKGTVVMKAELLDRKDGEDIVKFTVSDTGIGISAETQAALFQPFAQAGGDITRVFGGTGLGLSICQRLAVLMGSTISIASKVGEGTTMSLVLALPIADPASLRAVDDGEGSVVGTAVRRREVPSVEEAEKEGTLVLAVDDHPINRLVLMRQVSALGYANEAAENGREALEMWKSGRFGLVITDCNMPEMDGYELARTIRSIERTTGRKHTTLIACTANALRGEAENCFAAGMDDYIAKPVEMSRLLEKLDQWLPLPQPDADHSRDSSPQPASVAPQASDAIEPIDRSVVAEISGGDRELEREVFSQFMRVNADDIASLLRAMADHDLPKVNQVAHRIKGASTTVGAAMLAAVCERLEAASRANDWKAVSACLDLFHREVAQVNAYLFAFNAPRVNS